MQKFALWLCSKSWDKSYDDLLLNCKVLSLQNRRVIASLCHLCKIHIGLTEFDNAPLQIQESAMILIHHLNQCIILLYQSSEQNLMLKLSIFLLSSCNIYLEQLTKGDH